MVGWIFEVVEMYNHNSGSWAPMPLRLSIFRMLLLEGFYMVNTRSSQHGSERSETEMLSQIQELTKRIGSFTERLNFVQETAQKIVNDMDPSDSASHPPSITMLHLAVFLGRNRSVVPPLDSVWCGHSPRDRQYFDHRISGRLVIPRIGRGHLQNKGTLAISALLLLLHSVHRL